jgi:hypothetical protein
LEVLERLVAPETARRAGGPAAGGKTKRKKRPKTKKPEPEPEPEDPEIPDPDPDPDPDPAAGTQLEPEEQLLQEEVSAVAALLEALGLAEHLPACLVHEFDLGAHRRVTAVLLPGTVLWVSSV